MKTILTIVVSIMLAGSISAQENQKAQENQNEYKTIFTKKNDSKIDNGGYGAFGIGYTVIDGKNAMQLSFKGAWVIDHHFALGLAGYSFFNNLDKTTSSDDYFLAGGYGGFYFEPIIAPQSSVHVSFPILIGGGGVSTVPENYWDSDFDRYRYDYDIFFVFEPGVEIEFNVVKFFRLAVGSSYRLTNGVILKYPMGNDVPVKALDGFNFYVIFKFGKF